MLAVGIAIWRANCGVTLVRTPNGMTAWSRLNSACAVAWGVAALWHDKIAEVPASALFRVSDRALRRMLGDSGTRSPQAGVALRLQRYNRKYYRQHFVHTGKAALAQARKRRAVRYCNRLGPIVSRL